MTHVTSRRPLPSTIPDSIPDRLVFAGTLVRISGGLACYATLHWSGGGPGYGSDPELDEVSEAWVADRAEWDATFSEEPTPAAVQRHLDEALDEVLSTVLDHHEDSYRTYDSAGDSREAGYWS